MPRPSRRFAAHDALHDEDRGMVLSILFRVTGSVIMVTVVAGTFAWTDRGTPEGRIALLIALAGFLVSIPLTILYWRKSRPISLSPEDRVDEEGIPALARTVPREDFAGLVEALASAGPEEAHGMGCYAASMTFGTVAEDLGYLCRGCCREAPVTAFHFRRSYGGSPVLHEEFRGRLCRECAEAKGEHFSSPPAGLRGSSVFIFRCQILLQTPAIRTQVRRAARLPAARDSSVLDGPSMERLLPLAAPALSALRDGASFGAVVESLARKAGVHRCQAAALLFALLQVLQDNAWKAGARRKRRAR